MTLHPEEAAEIAEIEAREAAEQSPATDVRIYRPARYLPHVFAVVAAAIVWGLGSWIGALAIVAVLALVGLVVPRRVARYRYDDEGRLYLDAATAPLDWQRVVGIEVSHPTWTSRHGFSVLAIRITLAGGSVIRFARGSHFHANGPRRAVSTGAFERWLRQRARETGMRVETGNANAWTARRA